jgi:hypothetical protein
MAKVQTYKTDDNVKAIPQSAANRMQSQMFAFVVVVIFANLYHNYWLSSVFFLSIYLSSSIRYLLLKQIGMMFLLIIDT